MDREWDFLSPSLFGQLIDRDPSPDRDLLSLAKLTPIVGLLQQS